MSNYSRFEVQLLIAAYVIAERAGDDMVSVREILNTFALTGPAHWLDRAVEGNLDRGFLKDTRTLGSAIDQDLWLSPAGVREAERLIRSVGQPPRGKSPLLQIFDGAELPTGVRPAGQVYVTEGSVPPGFGKSGDIFLEMAPAADRVVPLNHNEAAYEQIASGLNEVREAVRTANEFEGGPDEKDRVLASMTAASTLWEATQLHVLQLKVGILMAAEDASKLLGTTAKASAAALLVEAIKAFVRNHLGIDLDKI